MDIQKYLTELSNSTHLSVIFQLTDQCVLSCKYCFARGSHYGDNPIFPNDLLKKIISESFLTHHENVSFEWTGGEAFLLGKKFFEKVVALQKEYAAKPYCNCVQTSGYLFDKELIDYLLDNGFDISLTIDGTSEVHNANRPSQSGGQSFDRVLSTYNYIKGKNTHCGFISTVTTNNLGHEKDILDLFRDLKANTFHSNPYFYFDKNIVKEKSIALENNDYARYYISQFNAWYESGQLKPIPHTVDYIISCLSSKRSSSRTLCTFGGRCFTNFIAISPNGDCYNCPKFIGHDNMKLGNIYNTPLPTILSYDDNDKMRTIIRQRIKALEKCIESECRFAFICNGGCPYLSYISSNGENIEAKDCSCEGRTILFEYLDSVKDSIIKSC